MPRMLRAAFAVAGVMLLSACTSVSASPAAGGYDPLDAPLEDVEVSLRDNFESSAAETHEYWSDPSIFESASPIAYTNPETGMVNAPSDPATGAYVPPTVNVAAAESANGYGDVSEAQVYDRNGLGGATAGRLYMQFPGNENMVCSATVVNSQSGGVVATAAHCLFHIETQQMAKSVVFIPGDRNQGREQPYGRWAAVEYLMPQNFIDHAEVLPDGASNGKGWATDFAFLIMEQKNGQALQQAVGGGQGIAFGVPVRAITQLGYPSAEPFDGSDGYLCASTNWAQGYFGGYRHACNMNPGSSGGGWLAYFDRNVGAGYIVAVSSIGSDTENEGSILGQHAFELYEQAGGYPAQEGGQGGPVPTTGGTP